MQELPAITVEELQTQLASATPPTLLDVREDAEVANCAITHPAFLHIPLGSLPHSLAQLSTTQPIAVICRSGGRSATATQFLISQGYNAINVTGGMRAWVASINPSLPTP